MLKQSLSFYKNIKNFFFPFYRDKELKFVFNVLQKGYPKEKIAARFVGGCVRKFLSGEKVDDIDIATILTTNEIKEKFKDSKFKIIDSGIKHGTVTLISDKHKLELTTLRKDINTDGRHADVEYVSDWKLDSERRDFTINAIYLDIHGNIFDPQLGTFDLKNYNVKFIGDPNSRIQEDYLRIIRLLRFAFQYDSSNDKTTIDSIKTNLDGIYKISKERIFSELMKMLSLKNFDNILKHPNKKEIFLIIFPELKHLKRLEKLKKIKNYFTLNNFNLLAILITDDSDNYEYFGYKYNISNNSKDILKKFNACYKILKKDKRFFKQNLYKNIYIYGKENMSFLLALNFTENSKILLSEFLNINKKIKNYKILKLPFDGNYLIENGLDQGVLVGLVLKKIEEEWIENNFKISEERVKEIVKLNTN